MASRIQGITNAYGVSLDQLCSGYAIMTFNGVATAESTTYMNAMNNELGKSGSKVSKVLMEETGSSFADLMAKGYSLSDALAIVDASAKEQGLSFNDMWSSSEAAKAGLILLGDSAVNFNGTLAKMNESTGSTEAVFDKLKTNSYTIQMAINQLKNTVIELGTAIMQVLAPIIASLADGTDIPMPDSYDVSMSDVEADSGGETETAAMKQTKRYMDGYKAKLVKDV